MTLAADILLALAILLDAAFIVLYTGWSDWRASWSGRVLLACTSVLLLLMGLRFWSRVFEPLGDGFWVVGFALLDVVFAGFLWLVIRSQRQQSTTGE